MQLSFGNSKTPYHLVQTVKIKKVIDNLPKENRDTLYSFKDELKLRYGYNTSEVAEIDVDYTLFSLLKRVLNGYVPSINDKRVNVKCMEFVNKISMGAQNRMNCLFVISLKKNQKNIFWNMMKHLDIPLR
ncbi:MAG: DNA phosphorothioation-dependent restriction protein DptF [Mediterraneibacter faecis]